MSKPTSDTPKCVMDLYLILARERDMAARMCAEYVSMHMPPDALRWAKAYRTLHDEVMAPLLSPQERGE